MARAGFSPFCTTAFGSKLAAAGDMNMNDHYGRLSACTARSGVFWPIRAPHKTRNTFPRKAVQRVYEVYLLEEWTRWTESEVYCDS